MEGMSRTTQAQRLNAAGKKPSQLTSNMMLEEEQLWTWNENETLVAQYRSPFLECVMWPVLPVFNRVKEDVCFYTLSLIIGIFTIVYDGLQHHYDKRCSTESWSSLLMSLLAENNRGPCAQNTITFVLKDVKLIQCLDMIVNILFIRLNVQTTELIIYFK